MNESIHSLILYPQTKSDAKSSSSEKMSSFALDNQNYPIFELNLRRRKRNKI
jgi:hypothetical protein